MARAAAIARRLAISALLTALLILISSAAIYVTTAPRLVSLLVEPFSLLLMPGLVVAVLIAGAHDFTPAGVVAIASVFYVGLFYWALGRRQSTTQIGPPRSR